MLGEEDVPTPTRVPLRGVGVKVVSASLNDADVLMVLHLYQEKPPLPFTLDGVLREHHRARRRLERIRGLRYGSGRVGRRRRGGPRDRPERARARFFRVPAGVSPAEASSFPIA